MKSNTLIHAFDDADVLAGELASAIARNLEDAIDQKGYAVLLVSGGNTPKKLFAHLSTMPIRWDKIRIGLCDERWVDPFHTDSNERLLREHLIVNAAQTAQLVGLYVGGKNALEAEELCSQRVKSLLWPIDVCVLGMGEDAHTASLFPGNPRLAEAYGRNTDLPCIAISPAAAPHERMSLTPGALLSSHNLYLHFEGERKRSVYARALETSDPINMPICSVICQTIKPVEVYYA